MSSRRDPTACCGGFVSVGCSYRICFISFGFFFLFFFLNTSSVVDFNKHAFGLISAVLSLVLSVQKLSDVIQNTKIFIQVGLIICSCLGWSFFLIAGTSQFTTPPQENDQSRAFLHNQTALLQKQFLRQMNKKAHLKYAH